MGQCRVVVDPPEHGQQEHHAKRQTEAKCQALLEATEALLDGPASPQGGLQQQQRPDIGRTPPQQQGWRQGAEHPAQKPLKTWPGSGVLACEQQQQQKGLKGQDPKGDQLQPQQRLSARVHAP
jgi:hypothetical protein